MQATNDTPRGVGTAAQAQAFLDANPDIETVQLVITDACGVGRGKNVAREELAALYQAGRNVAGSILGLDVTGEDVEDTGLVWAVGDADQCCRPVAGSLTRAPWLKRPTAQVLGTMFELDGTPARADPRHALAHVVARCENAGLTPVVAVELEFYLLERDVAGRLVPSAGMLSGARRERIDAYGLGRLDDMSPLFDDLYAAAKSLGLPVRTLMSEYAPGQFEITLEHRADALRAVDEADPVQARRARRRGTARSRGLLHGEAVRGTRGLGDASACKPGGPRGRQCLRRRRTRRQPAAASRHRRAAGRRWPTAWPFYAPNANSYRRFRSMSYAPVAVAWGVNNRSVSLRVPAGPAASRHVEHRVAGADANPYLVAALVLGGMLHGIERRIDPGPPVTGNAYAQLPARKLPTQWHAALEAAARSAFVRDTLGAGFLDVFLAIKRQEAEKFGALVSDRDYEWYLDTV